MNNVSVCINCGEYKEYVGDSCGNCGFKPTTKDEIAKSFILSKEFDAGEKVIGLTDKELERASETIKQGNQYAFNPKELESVKKESQEFINMSGHRMAIDIIKWLGPPLLLLALFLWAIF